jgi:GMP synthase-like glutamine amidotransferase
MKVCILENDDLHPAAASTYQGYAAMFVRLFHAAGANWEFDVFHTPTQQYPDSFAPYDAVLLTGSKADAFSNAPWVVELRRQVTALLAERKKLLGVCFGHQLIGLCLGAKVDRAPNGWGVGRMVYEWHGSALAQDWQDGPLSMLVSHQDQVLELPAGAQLLASNAHCPIAAYTVDEHVFCVQGHPEFVEDYSAFLLAQRKHLLGEDLVARATDSLQHGHDGLQVARMMVAFAQSASGCASTAARP